MFWLIKVLIFISVLSVLSDAVSKLLRGPSLFYRPTDKHSPPRREQQFRKPEGYRETPHYK